MFVTEYDKEDVINIVLILSGLSPDLRSHKKILEKIEIPEQIARLKETFQNIDGLSFDLADSRFFSTMCKHVILLDQFVFHETDH